MDKILQPMPGEGVRANKATVTNDGATILRSVWVDNPAAKILVDMSKTQDQMCGDGTTSVVVLAAEMLRNAERMVDSRLHPQILIKGYRQALRDLGSNFLQVHLETVGRSSQIVDGSGRDLQLRVLMHAH